MRFILIFTLIIFSQPAFSEENKADVKNSILCKQLAAYQSDEANYVAGVDVKGKTVIPADLNQSPIQVPEIIRIPLEIELAQRLNQLQDINIDADGAIGVVYISQDGRVFYEGKDISEKTREVCGVHQLDDNGQADQEVLENKERQLKQKSEQKENNASPKTNDQANDQATEQ
ncbi:MAG: hypothetical protein AAF988_01370 [Pseudomonadota bacterium]